MLTRNWPNGSLIFPCFISIPFIRPRNRIEFAVDNRLAFIQSDHPRESLSVPIACKLYLSRLSESKMSKKTFLFFFLFFIFALGESRFCLCDGTRLPHRSIDISFSIVMHNRTACDKLQITPLTDARKNTMRESRTRAAALFLSDLFYGSGGIPILDRGPPFLQSKRGKRRQKYFLKRFAEVLLLCRAIVTPNRKLALYILIYRVSTSCVKFLSFF